jgi:hypothetical protein
MQAYLHVQHLITGKKPSVSQEAFLLLIKVSVVNDLCQPNTDPWKLILVQKICYEKDALGFVYCYPILLPNE